jgi:pimeloyl-ACP methyl ester carboxylesterase
LYYRLSQFNRISVQIIYIWPNTTRKMKKITLLLCLLLLSTLINAQDLTGSWSGALQIQGTTLRIVFNVSAAGSGFTSTMDSPDQGVRGIPVSTTTISGNDITIEAPNHGISYKGTFLLDSNVIKGTFKQGPVNLPLTLSKVSDKATVAKPAKRPQDPTDFPYKQEEVSFQNVKAGNQLSGTLTMPSNGKVSKIVVFISGSGGQNRDEEIPSFNHRPFLVWSDWLTRKGIAVLRYDDRGVGKSTGQQTGATSADFADDAEAAINYINQRPDLKGLSIGFLGHSEGGMIAPMVAVRNPLVKFMVLLAGPGVPISELLVKQNSESLRLAGAPDSINVSISSLNRKIYTAIGNYKSLNAGDFKMKMDNDLGAIIRRDQPGNPSEQQIEQMLSQYSKVLYTPWFRYFIAFNPADYLSSVKCPVLAVNGTLDSQVDSEANLNGIKTSLLKSGNKKFEIVPLSGLNHLLQKATTGSPKEYAEISETVNPVALEKVSAWINKL